MITRESTGLVSDGDSFATRSFDTGRRRRRRRRGHDRGAVSTVSGVHGRRVVHVGALEL